MLAIDTRARARTLSFSHKHSLLDFPFLVIADGDFIVIRTFPPTLSVSVTGGNSAKKKVSHSRYADPLIFRSNVIAITSLKDYVRWGSPRRRDATCGEYCQ